MTALTALKGTLLVVGLALAVGAVALIGGGVVIGTVCALALVFVLPGIAFAISAPLGATSAERIALMPTLGVAALILVSVAIDALGIRLDANTWILALIGLSILGCLLAILVAPIGGQVRTPSWRPARRHLRPLPLRTLVSVLVVAALLAAAAVVTIESKHAQDRRSQFTQLWTLPGAAKGAATIGIANSEAGARSYTVRAESGGQEIASWGPVRIDPGSVWVKHLQTRAGIRRVHVVLRGSGESTDIHRNTTVTVR